jgi:2-polyprenyl-6-methoxyphenol hydroxylase-like FAD-dependent oxidoreductase
MEIETFHQKFGGPYVQLHRADLQSGLLTVAKENGVQIHTNSRVADFDLDKPEIILADGQSIHVDLVVSADGETPNPSCEKQTGEKGEKFGRDNERLQCI